jgi:lipoyl(octanoyl) transferase
VSATWRLIEHPPSPGDWNMAVDELLLRHASAGAPPCLRLYAWDRPTLSLGYFQSLQEIPPEVEGRYALIRRPTGGGAILHDREVTYSVAIRGDTMDGAALYDRANQAVLSALATFGIEAEVRGGRADARAQRGPFFCFARAGATDIIVPSRDAAKLAGSAQRRHGDGVLQHGSVLLDSCEPGAVGVRQVLGRDVPFGELASAIRRGFEEQFGCCTRTDALSSGEQREVKHLCDQRYGTAHWLSRGNRKDA